MLVYLATLAVGFAGPAAAYEVAIAPATFSGGVGTLTMPGSGEVEDYLLTVNAPTAFNCSTPTVYNASGTPTTQLFGQRQSPTESTFTPIGGPSASTYNAIAYNPANNLIYGVTGPASTGIPNGHLVVVDATGALTDQGAITGMSAADLVSGINAGAFDAAGNFWVAATNAPTGGSGRLYRVDLTTRVATALATQSAPLRSPDITFAHGFFWGISNGSSTIQRINLTTGVVAGFAFPAIASGSYGAAWTYGNGNLGFDSNAGGVYQMAVTNPAGTPTFSLVATGPGPSSANNDGTACVPGPVDLSIVKSGPATVLPNGQVAWTLTVHNNGPNISSGFVVNDTVPAGYTNVASSTAGCTVTGNAVQCLGGVVAVGSSTTISITATSPGVLGCITNSAAVIGNESDPTASNNTSTAQTCIGQNPALSLVKSAALTTDANADGKAGAGDVITFSFAVTNTGDVTLSGIAVVDQLIAPAGPAVSVTCPGSVLAPGASMTCTSSGYPVTQADVDAGSVANSATASGTPPAGSPVVTPPSTTTTPTLIDPGLSLVKKVSTINDANHDHVTDLGDTIQWTFAVRNTGNVTLRGVAINDGLLAKAGIAVSCPKSTLQPGEAVTCASAAYAITQADANAGHVANIAVSPGTAPSGAAVVSHPDSTLTRVTSGSSPGGGGFGGVLAFTGVTQGLFMAGPVGLLALAFGLLLVWVGRRAREVGHYRS